MRSKEEEEKEDKNYLKMSKVYFHATVEKERERERQN